MSFKLLQGHASLIVDRGNAERLGDTQQRRLSVVGIKLHPVAASTGTVSRQDRRPAAKEGVENDPATIGAIMIASAIMSTFLGVG